MLCIYVVEQKIIIWETQIFFFQKYPFLYNQTGFSKTNNALQKRKKNTFYTEILARKVDLGSFFFTSEKINKLTLQVKIYV